MIDASKSLAAIPSLRLLIVTDAVTAGPASLPPVVRFLIETASDRFVVSPRLTSPFEWLESDIDKATTQAEHRLRAVLTHFQSDPAPLDGTVGDETLRLAIEDAMNDFKPDHLIIGMRTHHHESWQERHLIQNVRHRFHVPLTVFEIDDRGQSPSPAYSDD
jgi:hypothetical protein